MTQRLAGIDDDDTTRFAREAQRKRPEFLNPNPPMDFAEFSAINRRRCEAPTGFNHALTSWSLSDWMTAVLGELGEAANVAKKLNRVRDGIPGNKETPDELAAKFKSEVADAFIYLDLMAQAAGFRLGDVVMETFNRKSEQIGYVDAMPR